MAGCIPTQTKEDVLKLLRQTRNVDYKLLRRLTVDSFTDEQSTVWGEKFRDTLLNAHYVGIALGRQLEATTDACLVELFAALDEVPTAAPVVTNDSVTKLGGATILGVENAGLVVATNTAVEVFVAGLVRGSTKFGPADGNVYTLEVNTDPEATTLKDWGVAFGAGLVRSGNPVLTALYDVTLTISNEDEAKTIVAKLIHSAATGYSFEEVQEAPEDENEVLPAPFKFATVIADSTFSVSAFQLASALGKIEDFGYVFGTDTSIKVSIEAQAKDSEVAVVKAEATINVEFSEFEEVDPDEQGEPEPGDDEPEPGDDEPEPGDDEPEPGDDEPNE